ANLSGWATWMKLGTMGILLRMIEDFYMRDLPLLSDPVAALKEVSRDVTCKAKILLRDGRAMSALDIQWQYCSLANKYLNEFGLSPEEDRLMEAWIQALTDLESDPGKLGDRADWAMKKSILEMSLAQSGATWNDLPRMGGHLLHHDLRYHELGKEGYFH